MTIQIRDRLCTAVQLAGAANACGTLDRLQVTAAAGEYHRIQLLFGEFRCRFYASAVGGELTCGDGGHLYESGVCLPSRQSTAVPSRQDRTDKRLA